jgi:hypothetical protein
LAQPLNVFVNGEDEGFRVFGKFPESTEGAIGIANIAVVQVHIDDIVGFVTMPLSADIIGKVTESQKVSGLIQPDAIVYAQSLAGEHFLGDVSDLGTAQNFKQLRSPPSSARERTRKFATALCEGTQAKPSGHPLSEESSGEP